ncbi:hypothetical protein ABZ322_30765, partial [Streptomyces sp. NPDC006129]
PPCPPRTAPLAPRAASGCRDTTRARELGAALAELRGRVPGRREGALDHVQRQLRQLQTQP